MAVVSTISDPFESGFPTLDDIDYEQPVNLDSRIGTGLVSCYLPLTDLAGGVIYPDIVGKDSMYYYGQTWQRRPLEPRFPAANFSAAGKSAYATVSQRLRLQPPISLSCWIEFLGAPDAYSGFFGVVYDSAGNSPYVCYGFSTFNVSQNIQIDGQDGSSNYQRLDSGVTLATGKVYHLVGTFISGLWTIYIDGVSRGTLVTNTLIAYSNTTSVSIGNIASANANIVFYGGMIHNRILSQDDVLYQNEEFRLGFPTLLNRTKPVITYSISEGGSGDLAGVCALSFGGTNTLTGAGALLGTAATAFGAGSSTLTGTGNILGTAALLFGGTNTLTGAGALLGTAAISFAAGSSVMVGAGALLGTSALVFGAGSSVMVGAGVLAGSLTITFGGTNTLSGSGALLGSNSLTFGAGSSTVSIYTALLYDTCTDTNGTSFDAHVPEIGGTWVEVQGVWEIQSNKVRLITSAGDDQNVAAIILAVADMTLDVDVTLPNSNYNVGVIVNYQDNNNYWLFTFDKGTTNSTSLYKRIAGTYTQVATDAFVPAQNTTVRVRIRTNLDDVDCWIDGVQYIDYNVASRQLQTARGVGPRNLDDVEIAQFDNWNAYAASGAIAGSSALVFGSGSSTLTASGTLLGTAALAFAAGSSTLSGTGQILGQISLTFGAGNTTATGSATLLGTAAIAFGAGSSALTAQGALLGSSGLVITPSGLLAGAGSLLGTTAIAFTNTGAVAGTAPVAGTSSLSLASTGALKPYTGLLIASFTAANGTQLQSYTPELGNLFTGFTAGTWDIQSGKLQITGSTGRAVNNLTQASIVYEIDVAFPNEGYNVLLYFNWNQQIPLAWWALQLSSSVGTAELVFRPAGGFATNAGVSATLPAQGSTVRFRIEPIGDTINIYADNVLYMTYTTANRINKQFTYIGVENTVVTSLKATFDNINCFTSVSGLAGTVVITFTCSVNTTTLAHYAVGVVIVQPRVQAILENQVRTVGIVQADPRASGVLTINQG